ncbi:MAG TPA: A24 family peptidase [Candidatus Dormibacteraeota bacterium]|nr:A24 family peptidase [Candidatus Dormibacteraeota bacterium]
MAEVVPLLVAVLWGLVGVGVGVLVRVASVWLARGEELPAGRRPWQAYGPVVLTALLFAVFGWRLGAVPMLVVRSLWVAVLVQVIFFDLEHQLILDRVLLPAGVAALLLSLVTPGLGPVTAILTGLVTGLVFLAIAALGAIVFKAEAMGLGDVKLSVFIGLVLGPRPTFDAVVVGLIVAGVVALALVLARVRTMRDSIPYGPFLAGGALLLLYTL